MLPSIELQLTDITGFNGESAMPARSALDSDASSSSFAGLLYQPLPNSDPVVMPDTDQPLPDSGNFLPPQLRESLLVRGQVGGLAIDGMVAVLPTAAENALTTQGLLQYETMPLQAISSFPASPQGQVPTQMQTLVDIPAAAPQGTPAALPTAAPLQTNIPVQTVAQARVQSQAQLQPQTPAQAPAQLAPQVQLQIQAQLQTPAQLEPQVQRQTQAEVQTPTQPQLQAQPQTGVRAEVPISLQQEAQVLAQARAPVVAAEPIAQQLRGSALHSGSAAMLVDRDISSGKAVTLESLITRTQTPTASIPVAELEMPIERRSLLSGAMPDPLSGLAERLKMTATAQSTQTPAPTVAIAPSLAAINPVATATLAPTTTVIPSPINVPLHDPAWGNALGDRVLFMTGQKIHHAEIRLNPAEMGPITIRVSVDDGAADVTFTAQHVMARDAIEAAMPRLRELLSENGLSLGNTSVTEQGVEQDRKGSETQQAREESGLAADGQRTDDATGRPDRARQPQGLVDTFV